MFWQRFGRGWNSGNPRRGGRSADGSARDHLFPSGNGGCEGGGQMLAVQSAGPAPAELLARRFPQVNRGPKNRGRSRRLLSKPMRRAGMVPILSRVKVGRDRPQLCAWESSLIVGGRVGPPKPNPGQCGGLPSRAAVAKSTACPLRACMGAAWGIV